MIGALLAFVTSCVQTVALLAIVALCALMSGSDD